MNCGYVALLTQFLWSFVIFYFIFLVLMVKACLRCLIDVLVGFSFFNQLVDGFVNALFNKYFLFVVFFKCCFSI